MKKGGTFLLNTSWSEEELVVNLPAEMKNYLAKNDINFYIINASKIAEEVGLGRRTNMIMQAAFFKLANVIPIDDAVKYLKDAIKNTYGRKGENIVKMNYDAVDRGMDALVKVKVPAEWKDIRDEAAAASNHELPAFIKDI